MSVAYSFTNYGGSIRNLRFVGFDNYIRAFTSSRFHNSLFVTVKFVVVSVILQVSLGLVFALILNTGIRGKQFFRSVIFLPTVISTIAVALTFMIIFHPQHGHANTLLEYLGWNPQPWLTSAKTAMPTIIIVVVWQSFGYYMVLFLSGLQTINASLYEAADIDGANGLQKLTGITIPLLTPITFFCVIMAVIRAFQVFDHIFIMTGGQYGGGPAGSTTVLVFDIYMDAFSAYQIGYASSKSVILLAIVLAITIFQYRRQNKWVNYDAA
ncbi:MAG: sugar ABC transporter permease [Spirochaetaceae bacterium]|nr:sugar ABC transporter permease [Spirochaetaceae bacterium]